MARPSTYIVKLAAKICDLIAEGESLRSIGAMPNMPSRRAMRGWLIKHPAFADAYEIARRQRTDNLVDEAIEIADSVAGCTDNAVVQAARLRVDTRRWLASKLLPERFGDHSRVEMTGAGGKDLIPEPDGPKLALALLNVLHSSPGGKNNRGTLSASSGSTLTPVSRAALC